MSTRRNREKSVTFDDAPPKVHPCYFAREELDVTKLWHSGRELAADAKLQRKWAKKSYKENPKLPLEAVRGLEDFLSAAQYREIREKTQRWIALVLEEQRNQRAQGKKDPERLRKQSRKISKYCIESAVSLARHDAKIARRIHKEGTRRGKQEPPPSPNCVATFF